MTTGGGVAYTYLDSRPVTVVTLDSGPVDGGNLVVITGTAFSYTTGVTFDGTPALPFRVASDTEIDTAVPAGSPGPANAARNVIWQIGSSGH
ncbi:IPT/TIG domain-containing protein [Streptomyces sp. NPDC056672]|uniref:IPT/TIG domain-containing protein n=1 Tax=Streptomyces sp. NPDC056672 TaxID=3345906 RepID=UPI0036CBD954